MDLERELNRQQRRAVTHALGPLLVLAGPGTGKTRVLTYRIAWLIQEGLAQPEEILAVTFTNKAAEEMRNRLQTLLAGELGGIWVKTFHAAALQLLREHGTAIGLDPHFVVFDEAAQADVLARAFARLGWGTDPPPRDLALVRNYISQRKAEMIDPAYDPSGDPELSSKARIGEVYEEALRSYNALDFDDLIWKAGQLLEQEDEIRASVQHRFRHVLVDEGHDMNPAQYALLERLAPPGSSVTVVADDNQSIYRWRGAQPQLIERFRQEYHPALIYLEETYRSTTHILGAAQHLIEQNRRAFPRLLTPMREEGSLVEHHTFATPAAEQAWLIATIRELVEQEGWHFGDVAILYRAHDLADPMEGALRQAGMPLARIQREAFFEQAGVREALRYLQLLRSFSDPYLRQALNFPRVIADELTMLQLRALADQAAVSLAQLARDLNAYPEVSPLTRAAVREFLDALGKDLLPVAEEPVNVVVDRLFHVLERRRSPFRRDELPTLAGFAAFLSFPAEVAMLKGAVDAGRPLALLAPAETDALCAAIILERTLADYLGASVSLHLVSDPATPPLVKPGSLPVWLLAQPARADALSLAPRDAGSLRYSLSTVAWRLAQGLLVAYETLDDSRFVLYDLETTGTSVAYDEIVEIGAITVDRREEVGQPFQTLVRPKRGHVDRDATAVHGLTWQDVRSAPDIDATLPRFLRYAGGATLAGHNVARFDNLILDREMRRVLKRRLTNPTLDTLEIARRILPGETHSLEALLARFKLGTEVKHRALPDVRQERDLLFALLAENRWHKEVQALPELLPLVAIGMRAAGVPLADENRALHLAAARIACQQAASPWFDRVLDLLPPERWLDESRHWAELQATEVPDTVDDVQWAELKKAWQQQVATFLALSADPSLAAFLDYAALATEEDAASTGEGKVTLMTLHNAKGKEFPVVFIIGVEDGHIPDWRNVDDEESLDEERRVLYV
ncbi:MAG: UvrD-helicase domain-containing protein, partial [Anaerolineae bacterium]|nr:UvrD-helicase domain-containing protein [Anaerolineae bacterium]